MHNKSLFYGSSDHLLFTTQIGDIATKEVISVNENATIHDAAQEMVRKRISSIIVLDGSGQPAGIVTDRDMREKEERRVPVLHRRQEEGQGRACRPEECIEAAKPAAPVKYRNPGIFSMAIAFLVGILFSDIFPEKDAEEKFATEKLREYVGIGAE